MGGDRRTLVSLMQGRAVLWKSDLLCSMHLQRVNLDTEGSSLV